MYFYLILLLTTLFREQQYLVLFNYIYNTKEFFILSKDRIMRNTAGGFVKLHIEPNGEFY